MTPGARLAAAIELLSQIWAENRPVDQLSDAYFKTRRYAGSSDRRTVIEILYQVLRQRARLDWWIARTAKPHEISARQRILAHLALTQPYSSEDIQALFNGQGHNPPPLDSDELALVQVLQGKSVNDDAMPRPVALEYPDWMEPSFDALWGDRLAVEMAALNESAPVDLRINTLKGTPKQVKAQLEAGAIKTEPTPLSPLGLRLLSKVRLGGVQAYRDGLVEVQDEGSQLLALLTGAAPGMTVIDYCAGAGGKTLALAASMADGKIIKGRLYGCDISAARLKRMEPRLKKAGALAVHRHVLDRDDDDWGRELEGAADRVLVDAPCTGTGTWRRDPQAKWRLTQTDLDTVRAQQSEILRDSSRLVRPGGHLIYATCSVLAEENEQQVSAFLGVHDSFTCLPIAEIWAETIGTPPPPTGPYLRLSPASTGTDGFFCAVMRRRN